MAAVPVQVVANHVTDVLRVHAHHIVVGGDVAAHFALVVAVSVYFLDGEA